MSKNHSPTHDANLEELTADGTCLHKDCLRDEPADMVYRKLKTSETIFRYCGEHDPLDDSDVSMMFERAEKPEGLDDA